MANYKLTNDYWETSGVYDITQGKTQREINAAVAANTGANDPTVNVKTATGDIATFDGAEGVPLKNLTVNIEPVQSGSGDPSPENVRPITGWTGANVTRTGKNLFDESILTTLGAVPQEDGSYYVQTATSYQDKILWTNPKGISGSLTFIYKFRYSSDSSSGIRLRINYTDGTNYTWYNTPSTTTRTERYTTSANKTVLSVITTFGSGSISTWFNIAISKDTLTDYEPFGETYEITFPSEAGTVYGGTLDVTNGVLTVDRAMLDLSTVNFTLANTNRFYGEVSWLLPSGSQTVAPELVCNIYKTVAFNQVYNDLETGITTTASGSTNHYIWIRDNTVSTPSELVDKLAANEAKAVVLKTNGNTYQLTPTEVKALLGTNNIWADCGDVDVEYGAYLTVVENQLGERIPKVAVAPIEKTTTASKAYSVNEMFFMGDKLYIATAPIASGATFTVGTNCDETTIGEILTTLLNA